MCLLQMPLGQGEMVQERMFLISTPCLGDDLVKDCKQTDRFEVLNFVCPSLVILGSIQMKGSFIEMSTKLLL